MTDDVELNEVKCPLLPDPSREHNGDIADIPCVVIKSPKSSETFTGLTKEELEKFAKDPFWRKLRLISFIVFWLIWLGMLIAAILIVVLSPRCPIKPKVEFWQKKTGYLVDTMAFVDSDNNGVGDFKGLSSKFDYIQKVVGAGYIILDNIFSGQYSNNERMIGLTNSFRDVDEILGNKESFKTLIKDSRKRGLEVVLTADFNSIHKDSIFFSKNVDNFMKWQTGMEDWLSRDGKPSKRPFKDQQVYSSSPENSSMFDLDLTNEAVLKEIKESVKMWLNLGVRGFLLTNVAFYIENVNLTTESVKKSNESNWYLNKLSGSQIFSNNTLKFLKEIRNVMNEVAKKTDKSRLLIVEAGNVGFGLTDTSDEMLQYLGGDENVVDMVVSREFLKNRGWNRMENSKSLVTNYLTMTKSIMRSKVALMSATSTSLRTTELRKIVAPFLLPGNPIIYYGSEIWNEYNILNNTSDNRMFYPKERQFFLENVTNELPTKLNHMVMPWDNTGKGFSEMNSSSENSFLINVKNTVQSLTAIGRGETILQLYQKLIKVRDEPSLQWGTIKLFFEEQRNNSTYEIFIREAMGFPKIIVAIIEDKILGKVFSFSSICPKIKPLLVYPENPNLPENKEVDASNIYLKVNNIESVHVFKCA